ncbi:dodecin domain-containing protein [Candidatus Parvarchaeota archaeon]|uniref:Dodecin domain-containing protein n=1 Tax=Candidatus Acidifodinimicrobium mancum TaxID=2898728 RepID=A0A8T3UVP4_9ARCH|nr:dodecin domain-containing protein [Candidatus Acidifodinimicrobium mancum]MBE5728764.1 dodecin domain-containing protein [Candidatus Acidifodinimicrobium mancum]MBE5729437.1 dodecin domain-containing protein [Candidatus Acidifodinimicrobium mancum]MBE5729780.1 dodecin domain-containing protein [Candidatus Acidifodinimicrobium mancum]
MGEIGKITELVSSSKVSIEDAVKKAAKELGRKEKDLRGIKIKNVSAIIKNGEVVEWRVNLKVSSEL